MSSRPRPGAAGLVAVLGGAMVLAPLAPLPARAAAAHPVINEVFGGGGNSGATLTHDFVELYNPSSSPVSLSGLSLQYFSATGGAGGTCALPSTASIAPGAHYLVQQAQGNGGSEPLPAPDATCALAMGGASGRVDLVSAAGLADRVGYGTATTYEGSGAAPALSSTTSATRTDGLDTDDNKADFTAGTPSPQNATASGGGPAPAPEPSASELPIAQIQGTGDRTPLVGQQVSTRGVVTAAYPTGGFNGVYLQTPGTGGTAKKPGDASDGIFLYSSWAGRNLSVGDCVVVAGSTAKEYNMLTELDGGRVTVVDDCAPVRPTDLSTLPASDADKEPYEGMLVQPTGTWTITNNYQLNQYGQLGLTPGPEPLYTATDVVEPGPAAEAYEAENQRRYITVDDGSSWDYLRNAAAKDSPLPYLSQDEPMRTGSQVTFARPVILDHRFQWNYQPTGQVVGATDGDDPLATENDRDATAPAVGGDVRVATFNVLNYFTDLGKDEEGCKAYTDRDGKPVAADYCEVRGAWSAEAFADQQAKIVAAVNRLDADVVSLEEIETGSAISYLPGQDRDRALAALVQALNAAGGNWAYVPSPTVLPTNEDVIRTAFIYRPDRVQVLGSSEILLHEAFANARYPLAQKFKLRSAGSPFVVVANHFKSKGSGEDDGTGQGRSNPSREAQAHALVDWVGQRYADEAVLLAGDFNAYSRETPVQVIEGAGYTDLAGTYQPGSATYQFGGRLGSLDHVFANERARSLVTGAGVWDINADESIAMQYSRRNYNVVDFHTAEPYASSDHDPILVGLAAKGAAR